jgi:hypothetical protein
MMMKRNWVFPLASATIAVAAALAAGRFVPLALWKPVFPGLLVALSMLGAAALVRLARSAPITAPAAFDEDDLSRFFNTLEELNRRLFWIFLQVVASIVLVLFSVAFSDYHGGLIGIGRAVASACSSLMAFVLVWLLSRVIAMASGDIGFLRLQREILENALRRQRVEAAGKAASALVEFQSPGGYGRALR